MRAYIALVASAALLLSAFAAPQGSVSASRPPSGKSEHQSLPYLHVEGTRLVDAANHEIKLRGVNLGGWLVTEAWMCGIFDRSDTKDSGESPGAAGRFTQDTLEARFGVDRARALQNAWEDHWITTADLDDIQRAGFNLVRVPISYRTLTSDEGSWMRNERRLNFSRMDWIVAEAGRRGIYTIFDLHVWPGQRFDYEKIGRPDGVDVRHSMSRLWGEIAAHYRGNGAVAGFDLINELPGAWGVQQALARSVRLEDPNRVQFIEGFTLAEFTDLHRKGVFPNGVFSGHLYGPSPLNAQSLSARLKEYSRSPAPVYIGEFLPEDFGSAAEALDHNNVSWSSWTLKTIDKGAWGLRTYPSGLSVDVQHDGYSQILEKWTAGLDAARAKSRLRL